MSAPDVLEIADRGAVRTFALNRPERRNALNEELLDRLPEELERAAGDPSVRAVVLTGRGGAFCAGGDLELMAGGVGDLDLGLAREQAAALLREMPKPTLAAVNGPAAGAGFSLALAADFRLASTSARFTPGFGAVALSGDYGVSYHLPRLVGREQALRLLLLGDTWDAETALRRGLVGAVASPEDFHGEVAALADRLAALAPLAVARVKGNVSFAEGADFAAVLRREAEGMIALAATDDFKEGLAAFGERRPPLFRGT
ncbi:MAG TPA: enoyl-CoA hydratase-related protein [Acidimicrobiia bacterium]|nr:enoyl-CoA hydratase-related protein [Acidimicrobiia bacterium]